MKSTACKAHRHKKQSSANTVPQGGKLDSSTFRFSDNRPEAANQRKLLELANNSAQNMQLIAMQDRADSKPQPNGVAQFVLSDDDLREWAERPDDEYDWMDRSEKEQMGRYKSAMAAKNQTSKDWEAALESRVRGMKCVSWDYAGKNYHINLGQGKYHVTEEASPKIHYFFKGFGQDITSTPSGNGAKTDRLFSDLPIAVQEFIKCNFNDLLL